MVEPAKDRIRDNVSKPLDHRVEGVSFPSENVSSHVIIIVAYFARIGPRCWELAPPTAGCFVKQRKVSRSQMVRHLSSAGSMTAGSAPLAAMRPMSWIVKMAI